MYTPINNLINQHAEGLSEVCDKLTQKIYNIRNYQDEIITDLFQEIRKWVFDSMGIIFKRFNFRLRKFIFPISYWTGNKPNVISKIHGYV